MWWGKHAGRLSCAVLLSACAKPVPSGQVLARVDGVDVTRRDVEAELQVGETAGISSTSALDRVVQRKLLIEAAQDAGIDRSSDYLSALTRTRDELLAKTYVRHLARDMPGFSAADIDAFVAQHPASFDARRILSVTEVDGPDMPEVHAALARTTDGQDIARSLAQKGVRVTISDRLLDTGDLPERTAQALLHAGAGWVILPEGGRLSALLVRSSEPAPRTGAAAAQAATGALRLDWLTRRVSDQIDRQRRHASITYQQGLGPTTP